MSWSNNNRAHTSLWFFEKWQHNKRKAKFTPSGEWGTDFLIESATGESPEMRKAKAKTHAEMLDGAFTSLFNAKYEEGVTRKAAISAMVAILNDSSNKMKDLGDPVDSLYRFIGEVE